MVEIREMILEENKIVYDDFSMVTYDEFFDKLRSYFNNKIAGETLSPFDMERFMKRTSSKNVSQLVHGKKAEGFLEATTGKKLDFNIGKFILYMIIIVVVVGGVFFVMKMMGLF